jgi:hypothetical protein
METVGLLVASLFGYNVRASWGICLAVADTTDIALSPEAADLIAQLRPRIVARLEEVKRVPVSLLLWGPGVGSVAQLASVRSGLRGCCFRSCVNHHGSTGKVFCP